MIVLYVVAGLIVVSAAGMIIQNNRIPSDVGVHGGDLSPLPGTPNAVASYTDDEAKQVDPLPLNRPAPDTLEILRQIVTEQGAEVITAGNGYLHGVYTSNGMKFHDDVEFLIREAQGIVEFRSASRVGYSDMGVNRRRYEAIRRRYLELIEPGPR